MSRRSLATVIAAFLQVVLFLAAAFLPLPYVRMQPGTTVDVLSTAGGHERIQVEGHKAWYDDGELRMVTVLATGPESKISLLEAMQGWLSDEEAVRPHRDLYPDDPSVEDENQRGTQQMTTSQDDAIYVALTSLGYHVRKVPAANPTDSAYPAYGRLQPGDVFVRIGDTKVHTWRDVVRAVSSSQAGEPLRFVVQRTGHRVTVDITPIVVEGRPVVGISKAYGYHFPFKVDIAVDPAIGGPSAGLIFSLAVYDTLTPGSLTGGQTIAGTGTIDPSGAVGPIGGIQQKIVAARDAGAELFLVPADNCDETADSQHGGMRLVRVTTMSQAREAIQQWVADPGADLPACEEAS